MSKNFPKIFREQRLVFFKGFSKILLTPFQLNYWKFIILIDKVTMITKILNKFNKSIKNDLKNDTHTKHSFRCGPQGLNPD